MAQIFRINTSETRAPAQGVRGSDELREEAGPLVIQIGFNRCATLTFHNLMDGNGVPALHWQEPEGRNVAQVMVTNMAMGLKPFERV